MKNKKNKAVNQKQEDEILEEKKDEKEQVSFWKRTEKDLKI